MVSTEYRPDGSDFTSITHADTYSLITPKPGSHAGKSILITGAARGISRSIALAFALAGASPLILTARSLIALRTLVMDIKTSTTSLSLPTPEILTIRLDVSSPESVSAAAQVFERSYSKLDILVNSAGVLHGPVSFLAEDQADWWQHYEVNVRGPYLLMRTFLPIMLKGGGDKTIVNIVSKGAHLLFPGMTAYQTTKLALLRLGELVDAEHAADGVLCYSVHPGTVLTGMADGFLEEVKKSECVPPKAGYPVGTVTLTRVT